MMVQKYLMMVQKSLNEFWTIKLIQRRPVCAVILLCFVLPEYKLDVDLRVQREANIE